MEGLLGGGGGANRKIDTCRGGSPAQQHIGQQGWGGGAGGVGPTEDCSLVTCLRHWLALQLAAIQHPIGQQRGARRGFGRGLGQCEEGSQQKDST